VKPGKSRQIVANDEGGSAYVGSRKISERLAFLRSDAVRFL